MENSNTENQHYAEMLKKMNLMDRFLFAEAIEHKRFAEDCLSVIMGKPYELKQDIQAEKEIRSMQAGKYVRLDGWIESTHNELFDIEVQKTNKYNLPKRSRQYQGMIDASQMRPGENNPNELKNLYIIFIAAFDPFGDGDMCYPFEMQNKAVKKQPLQDGVERIFLNTKGKVTDDESEELMWMLRYFEETTDEVAEKSKSGRIQRMNEIVRDIKNDPFFSRKLRYQLEEKAEAKREGMEAGRAEGMEAAHLEDAMEMKADGMSLDKIMKYTKLSRSVIEAL